MNAAETFIFTLSGKAPLLGVEFNQKNWDVALNAACRVQGRDPSKQGAIKDCDSAGADEDKRIFFDGSWFTATRIENATISGVHHRDDVWKLTGIFHSKTQTAISAEPVCRCSAKDLASGPHPSSCEWIRWKKAKK